MQLPVFDEVRDHLVSPDHPARDEGDLDYERCAALHNAIVKYAWTASGRSLEDLPLITCWEADADEWELDLDRLHPSMVEFLKRAYSTELPETELLHNGTSTEYKFFYFLEGLVGPHGHETPAYNYDDFEDYPGQYMTLYTPNDRLGSHPFGLVYDQETHECVINFENIWFEPTDRALPWQRLETVLSVYIDMIESEKVVCIRDDVEQSGDIKRVVVDGDIKWLDTRDRPDAIESPLNDQVEIPTIASEQPTDDHKDDGSSISEEIIVNEQFGRPSKFLHVVGIAKSVDIERLFEEFADVSPVNINSGASKRIAFIEFTDMEAATKAIKVKHGTFLCGTTVGTVAQVPEEIMKQSVGEAPIDITAGTLKYAPTQTIPDELMLSSKPVSLDQTTSLKKVTKRQRKVQKAKAAQSMIKEPAPSSETRLDKSVVETLSKSIKDQAETTTVEPPGGTSDDERLYDGNESASNSSIDQATFHDLEKDDLVYEDEPSSSDELQSKAYQELLREPGLRKGPLVDRVLPEIRQYATIPVPRTRAYYLPYSSQNRVLSGLQASLEQVCFRYLQRKHPELLEETPARWAIDSAHAFELNRVDIEALRFWAVDAVRLAELLDDSEAAKQFSSLVSSLEAQKDRMKAEKMKAEGDLPVTVRELAAKRAELLRVEREAMTAYEVAHKQLPTRTSELDKVIDANIPLGHGFGVEWKETSSVEGTSSAKPASGIFGRIKSWFGA
ncbi:hypothetical protein KCU92_g9559, partial [Aureobasidium melanogenum]